MRRNTHANTETKAESTDMAAQSPQKTPSLSPPKSSKCSQRSHPLGSPTSSSNLESGVKVSAKVLQTDIEANKSLAQHVRNRPKMDIEERTLRTEIYWLDSRIAEHQNVGVGHLIDCADNVRRLRKEMSWRQRKLEKLERLDEIVKIKETAEKEIGGKKVAEAELYRGFPPEAVLDCNVA